MGEATLSVMGSIVAGLPCTVTLVLGASGLVIASTIDHCSAGGEGDSQSGLEEAPEWSLQSIVYLNRLPPPLLSKTINYLDFRGY